MYPTIILGIFGITSMAVNSNGYHSLLLTNQGQVYAFGFGLYGQLGNGVNQNTNIPTLMLISDVIRISAGAFFSLLYTKDSYQITQILGVGYNKNGELGHILY